MQTAFDPGAPALARSPFRALTRGPTMPLTGTPWWGTTDELQALIATLYGNGEQGAMYIPKPQVLGQQVLYQDSAGTTPVVADGDPVGLMLDRSKRLELGPELVTNGTFDSDVSGWLTSNGSEVTWAGGEAIVTGGTVFGVYQPQSLVVGRFYEVIGYGRVGTADDVRMRIVQGSDLANTLASSNIVTASDSNQKMRAVFKAATTSDSVYLRVSGDNLTGYFDNISVRELPGNHATQSTSASRPTYRTDGTLHWLEFDGVDDELLTGDLAFLSGTNTSHIFTSGRLVSRSLNAGFFTVAAKVTDPQSQRSLADSGSSPDQMKIEVRGGSHALSAVATDPGSYEALFEEGANIGGSVNGAVYTESARSHNTANGVMTIGVGLAGRTPIEFFGMVMVDHLVTGAARSDTLRYNATLAGIQL